jgi:HEAT repeat protein
VTLRSGGKGGDKLKAELGNNKDKVPPGPGDKKQPAKETDGGRRARQLVEATGAAREKLFDEFRQGKGATYTEGLALAITKLEPAEKRKARDALTARLARMSAETLTSYLKDDEAEIRRAAAWACVLKDSKAHVPGLIELLRDRDPAVARTAHAALKELSGEKFAADAAEWKAWWAKQKRE